jgi:hypothetical protein
MNTDRLAELIAWGDVADAMKEMAKGEGAVVTVDADDLIEMCAAMRQLQAYRAADRPSLENLYGQIAAAVTLNLQEMPGRDSPDDQPEVMPVTAEEVHAAVMQALESSSLIPLLAAPPADTVLVPCEHAKVYLRLSLGNAKCADCGVILEFAAAPTGEKGEG